MYSLFGQAVEYCYTGGVEGLSPETALQLWALAEFLQIDGLQRVCEDALAAAPAAPALLGQRYALGLAYPSGARLRLAVAREVLEGMAGQAPPPEGESAAGWELGPEVSALLAAHPRELASDMAWALAAELGTLC